MAAPEWEDLDAFFDLGEFAVEATFALGDDELVVRGIFDAPYREAALGEYEADANDPTFRCREDAVAGLRRGTAATIGDREFRVLTVEPDGTGLVRVVLTEDA